MVRQDVSGFSPLTRIPWISRERRALRSPTWRHERNGFSPLTRIPWISSGLGEALRRRREHRFQSPDEDSVDF